MLEDTDSSDYYWSLSQFLEEVEASQAVIPDWLYDYYSSCEDLDEERYNRWQNETLGPTDGIIQDGQEHLEEYECHLQRANSIPSEWSYQYGPPFHCSYTQEDIPYDLLPENDALDCLESGQRYFRSLELVPMIIGRDGCHLKSITQRFGLHYVCYNQNPLGLESPQLEDGRFELWGSQDNLLAGADTLFSHINQIITYIRKGSAQSV